MNNKISLQDLSEELALSTKISKKASENFVRQFFEHIYNNVLEDKMVKIKGFGTFKLVEVSKRESVNVNTGERIVIPGHSKVTFTPENSLRDRINKPFADFQTVIINPDTPTEEMEYTAEDGETEISEEPIVEEVITESAESVQKADNEIKVVEREDTLEESPEEIAETRNELEQIVPEENETLVVPQVEEPEEVVPLAEKPDVLLEENKDAEQPAPITENIQENNNDGEDDPTKEKEGAPEPPTTRRKWLYVVVTILLMVGSYLIGSYFKLPSDSFKKVEAETPKQMVPEKANIEPDSTKADSTKVAKDSIKIEAPKTNTEDLKANAAAFKQVPGGRYLIVGTKGTHVMRSGDGLYSLARKEYGGNEFAQYIIIHNDLADPNNVPVGYEIKLPELIKSTN